MPLILMCNTNNQKLTGLILSLQQRFYCLYRKFPQNSQGNINVNNLKCCFKITQNIHNVSSDTFYIQGFSFFIFVSLWTVQVVLWSVEGRVKPISASTHPEFLVKFKELTTLTCCGAFPTEFVGFHRGECWGQFHHSVTVRLALTYRWLLIRFISSQDVNKKPHSELLKVFRICGI